MSIGLGIFLLVVGAILRFAINAHVGWLDLALTGDLLMIAGALVTILGLVLVFRRRRTTVTERTTLNDGHGGYDSSHVVDRAEDATDAAGYDATEYADTDRTRPL